MVSFLLISLSFYCLIKAVCLKNVPCNFDDDACVTNSFLKMYPSFIAGLPMLGLESSDPIHRDLVVAILPTLNYTFYNATMSGFKSCAIQNVRLNLHNDTWHYYMICPRLTMECTCEIHGNIESVYIQGNGKCKVIHDIHHINITGELEQTCSLVGELRLQIRNFKFDSHVEGGVIYKFDNLYNRDKERSEATHKFINENWRRINEKVQGPGMQAFLTKYIENLKKYFQLFQAEDIFYQLT